MTIIGKDLYKQRNARQPFQKGWLKGMSLVGPVIVTGGCLPGGRWKLHRSDARRCSSAIPKTPIPSLTVITGNGTRDDAPNHVRVQHPVPREVAEIWAWMCPAGRGDHRQRRRLTPSEGGDGPRYQKT